MKKIPLFLSNVINTTTSKANLVPGTRDAIYKNDVHIFVHRRREIALADTLVQIFASLYGCLILTRYYLFIRWKLFLRALYIRIPGFKSPVRCTDTDNRGYAILCVY